MKKTDILQFRADGNIATVHILPNPKQPQHWILMFKSRQGQSHFLLSEHEEIASFASLEKVLEELRSIGLKRAEIAF